MDLPGRWRMRTVPVWSRSVQVAEVRGRRRMTALDTFCFFILITLDCSKVMKTCLPKILSVYPNKALLSIFHK